MDAWLKISKDTPSKPKLRIIARLLGVSRGDAFLNCFELWAWADTLTTDGFIAGLTIEDVAELAGLPIAFCRVLASEEVHWMIETISTRTGERGILLYEWERHNGSCAKKRAKDASRQARHRWGKSHGNVTRKT